MKSEISTWIVFQDDAFTIWHRLLLSGFSITCNNHLWTIVHDNEGIAFPKDYHKLLNPGPYAEAAIEKLLLVDSERIFAKILEWGFCIKKLRTKQNLLLIYDPARKTDYLEKFSRHHKYIAL